MPVRLRYLILTPATTIRTARIIPVSGRRTYMTSVLNTSDDNLSADPGSAALWPRKRPKPPGNTRTPVRPNTLDMPCGSSVVDWSTFAIASCMARSSSLLPLPVKMIRVYDCGATNLACLGREGRVVLQNSGEARKLTNARRAFLV